MKSFPSALACLLVPPLFRSCVGSHGDEYMLMYFLNHTCQDQLSCKNSQLQESEHKHWGRGTGVNGGPRASMGTSFVAARVFSGLSEAR